MTVLWSFVLPTIACFGLWLLNNRHRTGWVVNAGAQFLWAAYGLATDQIGYTLFAGVFFLINVRGYLRWKPGACICECADHASTSGELA